MDRKYSLSLCKKIILITIGMGVFFEVFLRVFITSPSNHLYDSVIGFRYKPNTELFLGTEGFARNQLNNLGLNDKEFEYQVGTKRIILLGDSYTEARQVDRGDNFSSLTEKITSAWDIINAGRDGLHILNYYHVANRLKPIIKPDLLVLVMNNGDYIDDLADKNVRIIHSNNKIKDVYLQVKGKEQLKQKFDWLIQHSALVVQVIRQLKPVILDTFSMIKSINIFGHKDQKKNKVINSKVKEFNKKEIFSAYLKKLQTIAPVAILYINQLEYKTVNNVYPAEKPYKTSLIVKGIAKENNIIFINTADYLVNQYFATGKPPFGFHNKGLPGGHLNENGHIAVSKALSELINRVERQPEGVVQ